MVEEEGGKVETSTFSYIWYTAIWYLVQFIIITSLHFLASRKLDKNVVQRAASDTLLLALLFLSLQWSQRFLSCAISRLPYVVLHLFVDLIPTAVWLGGSQLLLLECLGLAQKLYFHLTENKVSTSTIESCLTLAYFTSVGATQSKIEHAIQKHISKQFPRLSEKLEQRIEGSAALSVLFTSASLLLQLSTLGLVFVNASWIALKTGYQRLSGKRIRDVRRAIHELVGLTLASVSAAGHIQYRTAASAIALARQTVRQVTTKNSKDKSMNANNGTSGTEVNSDDERIPCGELEIDQQHKQHDD